MVSAGNIDHDHSNISFVNFFFYFKEVANFSVEADMNLWFLSSGAEIWPIHVDYNFIKALLVTQQFAIEDPCMQRPLSGIVI